MINVASIQDFILLFLVPLRHPQTVRILIMIRMAYVFRLICLNKEWSQRSAKLVSVNDSNSTRET